MKRRFPAVRRIPDDKPLVRIDRCKQPEGLLYKQEWPSLDQISM